MWVDAILDFETEGHFKGHISNGILFPKSTSPPMIRSVLQITMTEVLKLL